MIINIILILLSFVVGFYIGMSYIKSDIRKAPYDYFTTKNGKIIPINKN